MEYPHEIISSDHSSFVVDAHVDRKWASLPPIGSAGEARFALLLRPRSLEGTVLISLEDALEVSVIEWATKSGPGCPDRSSAIGPRPVGLKGGTKGIR